MERIYVFGTGKIYKQYENDIVKEYEIVAMLDNAVPKKVLSTKCGEISVYNPEDVLSNIKDKIMIMSKSFIQMYQQLVSNGILDENIIFYKESRVVALNRELFVKSKNGDLFEFHTYLEYEEQIRNLCKKECKDISRIAQLSVKPFDSGFGSKYGMAVDRYYIERFLNYNVSNIKGTVLEVGQDYYMKKYDLGKIDEQIVTHVKGWNGARLVNFETGEGVVDNSVDCLICTQVLQYIYNLENAFKNIYRMLKIGGCALITVPGIKSLCTPDDENWGEYWSFTYKSIKTLCEKVTTNKNYEINTYGNAKVSTAYLYGVCKEELTMKDLEYNDSKYPFIITAKIRK